MKKRSFVLALALALPFSAAAHKQWLVPSATVVAGNDVSVTVDAAVSNQLFYPDHVPMRLDNIAITAPDGSRSQPQNASTGKYRSVFDVNLVQDGTYRISNVNAGLSVRWEGADGKPTGLRGAKPEDLAKVPKDAKNLQIGQTVGRVETFVTKGSPNDAALKATGEGLELAPVTHPNDLFAGEEAKFRLLIDGKPAKGLEVEIIRGGTRYRNAQDEIKATTNAEGEFSVTWPEAGMYWLQATAQDDKTSVKEAKQRRLSYVATLEVLPQ